MDLHGIDLNLLVAFDALIAERSVTRAGARIGRTQPAMSAALSRLRALIGDELFVRGPSGLEPTPRALDLAEPLGYAGRDPADARLHASLRAAFVGRDLHARPVRACGSRASAASGRASASCGAAIQRRRHRSTCPHFSRFRTCWSRPRTSASAKSTRHWRSAASSAASRHRPADVCRADADRPVGHDRHADGRRGRRFRSRG